MKLAVSFILPIAVSDCLAVADAFSLRMSVSSLPQPFRPAATSPPPKSALHLAPTAAAPIIEYRPRVKRTRPAKLGLITFDLDDSLYPIEPVLADENEVFVETVAQYGYSILPEDIDCAYRYCSYW